MLKITILILSFLFGTSVAFQNFLGGGGGASKGSAASKAIENEAIAVFDNTYPFGATRPKSISLGGFGMPNRDIDGTVLYDYGSTKDPSSRLTDITEKTARQAFAELSKLYGPENALTMVEAQPLVLCFNYKIWAASLKEWETLFGLEKAQGMVVRNPGLLAVSPKDAATTTEQAIVFSYIVAYTRPFSKVLLPLLLFLLLSPAIEDVTGIPIRSTFLDAL